MDGTKVSSVDVYTGYTNAPSVESTEKVVVAENKSEKIVAVAFTDSDATAQAEDHVFVYKTGFKNSVDGKNFKPLRKNSKENHSPAILCSHASNEAESMCSDSSDDTLRMRTLDVKSSVI